MMSVSYVLRCHLHVIYHLQGNKIARHLIVSRSQTERIFYAKQLNLHPEQCASQFGAAFYQTVSSCRIQSQCIRFYCLTPICR